MRRARAWVAGAGLAAVTLGLAAPAAAMTLQRVGLENLVAGNGTIVRGEVLDAFSYWNTDRTFILTDVRVLATEVLKGDARETVFNLTLMGGAVADITVLVPGTAILLPGRSYVLFLNPGDLPGVRGVRTVTDHAQGVFEIVDDFGGSRAVSQAGAAHLVADEAGLTQPFGGEEGLPLAELLDSVRRIVAAQRGGK